MSKKVLVVDDDIALIRAVQYVAEFDGYEVITSDLGGNAVELYTSESPRIVFLDINLPDISGFEVLEQIATLDHKAVIIIITASDSLENEEVALRLGAKKYLAKPLDLDDVRSILQDVSETETN
jgi:DNA-binding response OmpR family regulator